MVSIARELLFHDKPRLLITIVSLSFAIVMVVYDMSMFYGVTGDSIILVDRAQAELWISQEGENRLNAPSLVPKTTLKRARRIAGVAQACALDYTVGNLKIADTRQVTVIGIDPACPLFQPWEGIAGSFAELGKKDAIVVDDLALKGINQARVGDEVKINDHKVHIVAITHNNKSFSYPFAYVSFQTFEQVTGQINDYNFIALRLAADAQPGRIAEQLNLDASKLMVSPAANFKAGTVAALIAQGVGMIFVVVLVGAVVGMMIITMTMYTATMEQLRDFAILKALGARRGKIWGIVLEEAVLETTASFAVGLAASLGVNALVEGVSGIRGRFPPEAIAGCFGLMLFLAVVGSLLSIRKAVRVDPIMVFHA